MAVNSYHDGFAWISELSKRVNAYTRSIEYQTAREQMTLQERRNTDEWQVLLSNPAFQKLAELSELPEVRKLLENSVEGWEEETT